MVLFIESGASSWERWRLGLLVDIEAVDDEAKAIQPFGLLVFTLVALLFL